MLDEITADQIDKWIKDLGYDLKHSAMSWTPALLTMLLEIHLVRLLRDVMPDRAASMKLLENCAEFLHFQIVHGASIIDTPTQ